MEQIKKTTDNIKNFFNNKQNRTAGFVVILGFIGILFVLLSDFVSGGEEIASSSEKSDFYHYESEEELETKLEEIISKISGAGRANVMLTFDSSSEYIFATNSFRNKETEETEEKDEFVIIDGKNGEEAILLKMNKADVRGVLVICEGGGNPIVREKIIEALCALLDIPSNKVSVAEMA